MSHHLKSHDVAQIYFFTDCGTPSETTGYVLGTVGSVVYQSTRDVTCAVGYAGSPDPILCQANASWTEPSGCVLVGMHFCLCKAAYLLSP